MLVRLLAPSQTLAVDFLELPADLAHGLRSAYPGDPTIPT